MQILKILIIVFCFVTIVTSVNLFRLYIRKKFIFAVYLSTGSILLMPLLISLVIFPIVKIKYMPCSHWYIVIIIYCLLIYIISWYGILLMITKENKELLILFYKSSLINRIFFNLKEDKILNLEEEEKIKKKFTNIKKAFTWSFMLFIFGIIELFFKHYILSFSLIFQGVTLFIASIIYLPKQR